jgi:cysteine desulfurase
MRIYLDHNATTPVREEVADEMSKTLRDVWGNPSSTHAEGAAAKAAVALARERVAACLGANPNQVIFTGGATESNNTVLLGLAAPASARDSRLGLVTSAVEHPSVVAPAEWLEARGLPVTRLPVDEEGLLEPDAIVEAATGAALVSLIWANNETGVVLPIPAIAEQLSESATALHVDATQAIGKWPIDVSRTPVDYLSCTAHKFNGPKGVGCLVVQTGREVEPLLHGGPQERQLRGGTENLAGIVGMGVACELAQRELSDRINRYAGLRDRLWEAIRKGVANVRRNGSAEQVLPNTLNLEFEDTAGEVLLQALDLEGIAVSAGAACHSGSISPSHVLSAMGRTPEQARGCLRFSVGHGNDEAQIDRVAETLAVLVPRVREAASA